MSNGLSNALAPKRFSHQRVDDLFSNAICADKDAKYSKYLHMNLSTLSPYVSGPNSVKTSTPVEELEAQNIKIDKAYVFSEFIFPLLNHVLSPETCLGVHTP